MDCICSSFQNKSRKTLTVNFSEDNTSVSTYPQTDMPHIATLHSSLLTSEVQDKVGTFLLMSDCSDTKETFNHDE